MCVCAHMYVGAHMCVASVHVYSDVASRYLKRQEQNMLPIPSGCQKDS